MHVFTLIPIYIVHVLSGSYSSQGHSCLGAGIKWVSDVLKEYKISRFEEAQFSFSFSVFDRFWGGAGFQWNWMC